jgi:hypothetical protein
MAVYKIDVRNAPPKTEEVVAAVLQVVVFGRWMLEDSAFYLEARPNEMDLLVTRLGGAARSIGFPLTPKKSEWPDPPEIPDPPVVIPEPDPPVALPLKLIAAVQHTVIKHRTRAKPYVSFAVRAGDYEYLVSKTSTKSWAASRVKPDPVLLLDSKSYGAACDAVAKDAVMPAAAPRLR